MNDVCAGVRYGTRITYADAFNNPASKTFWEKDHVDAAQDFLRSRMVQKSLDDGTVILQYPYHYFESVSEKE